MAAKRQGVSGKQFVRSDHQAFKTEKYSQAACSTLVDWRSYFASCSEMPNIGYFRGQKDVQISGNQIGSGIFGDHKMYILYFFFTICNLFIQTIRYILFKSALSPYISSDSAPKNCLGKIFRDESSDLYHPDMMSRVAECLAKMADHGTAVWFS